MATVGPALRVLLAASLLTAAHDCAVPGNATPSGESRRAEGTPGRVGVAPSVPTVADRSHNAFGRALRTLSPDEWSRMHAGKRVFVRTWRPAGGGTSSTEGLGPLYNADACVSCHFKDGRGGPRVSPQPSPPLIYRLGPPPLVGGHAWGTQLQEHAIGGPPEGRVSKAVVTVDGRYTDGERYRLQRPLYRVREAARQPLLSPRVPPTLIGVGLIEAVDDATILAWADPEDRDGDGISGRARMVDSPGGPAVGRFGWKAARPSLPDQVAGALLEDMGITSAYGSASDGAPPEISATDFARLIDYLRFLAPPARRDSTPQIARGEALFDAIGCAGCHRPRLETGTADHLTAATPDSPPSTTGGTTGGMTTETAALAHHTIDPYTDLLLHDLGEGLADKGAVETGVARGEWRTPPLWGLGLMETVNGALFLLHDGRARSFEEAILWHGGEALQAQRRFLALSRPERDALVAFLESI